MIGVVIATHGEFGNALLSTLKMILGEVEGLVSVPLYPEDSLESFKDKMEIALQGLGDQPSGSLVLVDMVGGTPFNVAVQLVAQGRAQVVAGVNLPMLIKVASHRDATDLGALTVEVQKSTRESIMTSIELFKKK
jgi:PTS system mannose-specific IIA component